MSLLKKMADHNRWLLLYFIWSHSLCSKASASLFTTVTTHTTLDTAPGEVWWAPPRLAYRKWSGPYQQLLEGEQSRGHKAALRLTFHVLVADRSPLTRDGGGGEDEGGGGRSVCTLEWKPTRTCVQTSLSSLFSLVLSQHVEVRATVLVLDVYTDVAF